MPEFPAHNSPFFDIREFIDRRTFKMLGPVFSQWMIKKQVVQICDKIRELSGAPCTVNNWHFAKPGATIYEWSGYRPLWTPASVGSGSLSQHRLASAADLKARGLTPKQVHALIFEHAELFKSLGLTTLEDLEYTKSWTHIDIRDDLRMDPVARPFLIVQP